MNVISAIFNRLTLRCFFAVGAGALIVSAFSSLLTSYGDGQEAVIQTADQTFTFPTNQKTLQSLASHLVEAGKALNNIEPAAGQ